MPTASPSLVLKRLFAALSHSSPDRCLNNVLSSYLSFNLSALLLKVLTSVEVWFFNLFAMVLDNLSLYWSNCI